MENNSQNQQNLLDQIQKVQYPTIFIDIEKCKQNVKQMQNKIKNGAKLRPHFKTHQSAEIGLRVFKEACGLNQITVSSPQMAQYFAENGFDDITIAFPLNVLEIKKLNKLAQKIKLNVLLDNMYSLENIIENIQENVQIGVFIDIDLGQNRSGIDIVNHKNKGYNIIDDLVQLLKTNQEKGVIFKGFLNHSGHSYTKYQKDQKNKLYNTACLELQNLKNKYIQEFPNIIISYGDTPTLSVQEKIENFDELRPGNFVLYDVEQHLLGSCQLDQIAIAVACPIVGIYEERKQICIYGGGIHFAKDWKMDAQNEKKYYGIPVLFEENGWKIIENSRAISLSQEHGVIEILDQNVFKNLKVGSIIGVLPIHSCMTVDKFRQMYDFQGNLLKTVNY